MELEIPRMPTAPQTPPSRGACDAHAHVFGPYDRFPLALPSSYPPPDAPFATHRTMLETLGLERGVLVQPAPYATDNSALVDALRQSQGRLRGIAVIDMNANDRLLDDLNAAGVRGMRFVEMRVPTTGARFAGSIGTDCLRQLAPRFERLGWHAQVWGNVQQCASCAEEFSDVGIPLVFDHIAGINAQSRVDSPEFQTILRQVRSGRVWVKLSVCRVAQAVADYEKARPFHDALIEANPDRLLWGTDFPFVRKGADAPDAAYLLDLFREWVADADIERRILVENPQRLYGF